MNLKKITALMLSGVLCLGLFAGCSAPADSESESESTSQSTSESTSAESTSISEFDLSQYLDEDGFVKGVDFDKDVELFDYKSIVIPKEHHVPTDEALATQRDRILASFAGTVQVKEGTVPDGATLNIDYVGSVDGVEFAGGSTQGMGTMVTIGVTQYIDDFLQQLVGKEIGSNFDIEVTFPEDYGKEELNGKDAIFNITINYMEAPGEMPELTEEFVKENLAETYEIESVQEFNDLIYDALSDDLVNAYIYDEFVANCKVNKFSQNAYDLERDYILANYEQQAVVYGYTLDEFLAVMAYTTREGLEANNKETIEQAADEIVILQAIAKKENIKVTEDMIVDYFGTEDYSSFERAYGKPFIRFLILQTEVLDFLTEETAKEQ